MDSVRSLSQIPGAMLVNERNAHRNKGDEAFREALERETAEESAKRTEREAETPLRSRLQVQRPRGRKEQDEGKHIDVFA